MNNGPKKSGRAKQPDPLHISPKTIGTLTHPQELHLKPFVATATATTADYYHGSMAEALPGKVIGLEDMTVTDTGNETVTDYDWECRRG
ncbi:hypothetical protein CFP56_036643 [Quercus suber]|uniref:Uncharacterized protein n=1 Tax=Quercus suber TaxID=58331 RepID=A0AAW0J662_QUESU